jgi:hypothetical protein
MNAALGIRWTIGDVSPPGFEALRLSIHGAVRIFGNGTAYVVYVNSIPLEQAQLRTGPVPDFVEWREPPSEPAPVLRAYLDHGMAEGVAWKLLPLSAFSDRYELALDNDVVLWSEPNEIQRWRNDSTGTCLIAEDVVPAHGAFASLCGTEPRNTGIRGTPPGFDLESALAEVLRHWPAHLSSELDEQGVQIAALSLQGSMRVVTKHDVTICSPFYPHQPYLGRCGAHFVGLNARTLPWRYYNRPATEVRIKHWQQHTLELYRRVGLAAPSRDSSLSSTHSSSGTTARVPDGGT